MLRVSVVPRSFEMERVSRSSSKYIVGIDIGIQRRIEGTPEETVSKIGKLVDEISQFLKELSEHISGDVTATLGELCVFTLNDSTTRADWMIVPETKFYIDSSGSSLAFASNVPARYTIIAAIVEAGQSKIITHIIDYGLSPEPTPEPTPQPKPTPKPEPVTLSDWVQKNIPQSGYSQVSALAACYESVVTGIETGRIQSQNAAYSLIRTTTQSKIKIALWRPFLDQLSIKITESLNGSTDIHKLGTIFSEVVTGLNAIASDGVEPEVSTDGIE
jgi:hypothetical protein